MRLTVLGMNGPFPASNGATSGYLLSGKETQIALDFGSGTLARLTSYMPPEGLAALLLSHWHFDHCSDVLPLLFRLQACAQKPLKVYAPVDETATVRQVVASSAAFELHDITPGDTISVGEFTATIFAARHPVPGVMFRITDGHQTLCYTGDTNTLDTLPAFADHADLLLADGLFTTEGWTAQSPHLSSALAAELAQNAHVRQLVITHLNPRIDSYTLLQQAREFYPTAQLAECGVSYDL